MLVKIGVSFSAREAREILRELQQLEEPYDDGVGGWTLKFPSLFKLSQKFKYPTHADNQPAPPADHSLD